MEKTEVVRETKHKTKKARRLYHTLKRLSDSEYWIFILTTICYYYISNKLLRDFFYVSFITNENLKINEKLTSVYHTKNFEQMMIYT